MRPICNSVVFDSHHPYRKEKKASFWETDSYIETKGLFDNLYEPYFHIIMDKIDLEVKR